MVCVLKASVKGMNGTSGKSANDAQDQIYKRMQTLPKDTRAPTRSQNLHLYQAQHTCTTPPLELTQQRLGCRAFIGAHSPTAQLPEPAEMACL